MPRAVDPGDGDAIGLAELVDTLDAGGFDPADEDCFASFGPLLARLARNRGFLAELAIDELKHRCARQRAASGYGPQVMLLGRPHARYLLRANFWPARADAVVRASGTAPFFYDMPHDHNFSFLTVGYLGPGYWSDYYEYDGAAVVGAPGEDARMRHVEQSRLSQGRVLLYRAHRDIHVQLPPDAFSVSINILGRVPGQAWRSQYRFDIASGTIAEALTATPAEVLVRLATRLGGGDGIDLAVDFASRHPAARMRATAVQALASAPIAAAERVRVLETAANDRDALVATHARTQLAGG